VRELRDRARAHDAEAERNRCRSSFDSVRR
jgi:hypothetical protein